MTVLEDILSQHLAELKQLGRSPGTIYSRKRAIERMADLIPVPLLEATTADLTAWRTGLRVTDNTAVHYASHARGFFAWLFAKGVVDHDPAAALLVPPLSRGLPRPIGEDDLMMAMLCSPAQIRPWLVLAAWEGLRAKEIALLRRERVLDTASSPVLVIARGATKGRRERIVPLSSFVLAELRAAGLPRAGWVFPRRDGKPGPNSPARVSQLSNRFLHSMGIEETLHQLRHRFGTVAYAHSKDLRLVQELMGHARPESTAGYTAYNQAAAAAVIEALPAPGRLRVIEA